ncbi:MAG TPA: thioredoxin domain-containing protein [Herpetosiphonaceae bacterium]|nr:thioredoxin domain-containing protein [Herpetosiphonaceae bacterium]
MANRSKPASRRPVRKRSLMPFYLGLGLLSILGLIVVLVNSLNPAKPSAPFVPQRPPMKAAVGQTADGFWYKGDPNAPVKVVEYADFECPGCAGLETELVRSNFDQNYIETGKVQYIYREFPLTRIHPSAQLTAEVSRCAGDQNVYWPVHYALFDTQLQWAGKPDAREIILGVAAGAGADRARIESCLASQKYTNVIRASEAEALKRGLGGTPTVFVNDKEVEFVTDFANTLAAAVDSALGSGGATP